MRVTFPSGTDDLLDGFGAAFHYWIHFGGIGARTRRGLGALYCSKAEPWEQPQFVAGDIETRKWPTLTGARLVLGPTMKPAEAWEEAIRVLSQYRQQRTGPRGRSWWPEPDAIRRLRGQRAFRHSHDVTSGDIFPRAQFGLPIIFHFKTPGDPLANTLQIDKATDRLASPVIVKPLAISPTQACPLILALNTPRPPAELLLRQKGAPDEVVDLGELDVATGLLNFAAKEWKTGVRPL